MKVVDCAYKFVKFSLLLSVAFESLVDMLQTVIKKISKICNCVGGQKEWH